MGDQLQILLDAALWRRAKLAKEAPHDPFADQCWRYANSLVQELEKALDAARNLERMQQ